jgi:hypothetical protein
VFGAVANASLGGQSVDELAPAPLLLEAVHHVFLGVIVTGALMIAAVAFIPRDPEPLFPEPTPPRTT